MNHQFEPHFDDGLDYEPPLAPDNTKQMTQNTADGTTHTRKRSRDTTPLQLEPLENAGGINVAAIQKEANRSHLAHIARFLDSLSSDKWNLKLEQLSKNIITSHLHSDNIKAAQQQNAISRATRGEIIMFIHAFIIRKTSNLGRLIGHPKLLNEHLTTEQLRLSLGSTTELLVALNKITQAENFAGKIFYAESDYKNFFPQIPLAQESKRFFGIANVDEHGHRSYHRMNVLVQGWDKSAHIAQAISWLTIIIGDDTLETKLRQAQTLPGILTHSIDGDNIVIAITYDNILIASNSETHRNIISTRLQHNARKWNIKFKYNMSSTSTASYCGLDFSIATNIFTWRISPAVAMRWKEFVHHIKPTPRVAMQLFGFVCRLHHLRQTSVYQHRDILTNIQQIAREMHHHQHKLWKTPGNETCIKTVSQLCELIQKEDDPWTTAKRVIIHNNLAIFTDASSTRLGYVDHHPRILLEGTRQRTDTHHINIAEAEALAWAVTQLQPLLENPTWDTVTIGTDNTTVGRALLRNASGSPDIDTHIQTTFDILLKRFKATNLLICDTPSSTNVADVLTRDLNTTSNDYAEGLAASAARVKLAISNGSTGSRWTSRKM